jgi:hypothetical protein
MQITQTLDAVGRSNWLPVRKGESFTYSADLSVDFDGVLKLQRTFDAGQTWETVETIATDVSTTTVYDAHGHYSFLVTLGAEVTLTGTVDITLADVAESASGVYIVYGGQDRVVFLSGDITIDNEGVVTIGASKIDNAKVAANAAIAFSKLAALASGKILVGSAGNVPTAVDMSGDATISNAGALTIGAKKVTPAKTDDVAILYSLGAPEIASVDAVVASANMQVGTYTVAASPDVPRNITVTRTVVDTADTPGTITIDGTNYDDAVIQEVITVGAHGVTVAGVKAFKTVTAVTGAGWVIDGVEGTPDTITVGYGNELGLPVSIAATTQAMLAILDATITAHNPTVGDPATVEESTIDLSAGTYDGSKAVLVFVKN